ncbi:MAG TPA: hypothetical protein VK936_03070 [Longimicrobiales bacterium]|nr:hypothetical protein [Longimicrobiales bacterium]
MDCPRHPGRHGRAAATLAIAFVLLLHGAPAIAQEGSVRVRDVTLHFWPGQERFARSLLPRDAALQFPGIPPDILDQGTNVDVYIAPDAERFDSITGGRVPDWGAGVAIPQRGMIVLPGYVSERTGTHTLPVTLRHELAHIALQRHLGDIAIPRWFNEGYATWTAGQLDADAGWMLRLAFATNRAPSLDSLTLDWPLLAADARLAYLLSASAMRYMYSLGSDETFERFLGRWRESGSFEGTLREVYVVSTPQFERLWRAHVKRTYGWLQILVQSMFVWLVVAVLVAILFGIRRRRDRARLAPLRETEPPDEPAYWLDGEGERAEPPAGGAGDAGEAGAGERDARYRGDLRDEAGPRA